MKLYHLKEMSQSNKTVILVSSNKLPSYVKTCQFVHIYKRLKIDTNKGRLILKSRLTILVEFYNLCQYLIILQKRNKTEDYSLL